MLISDDLAAVLLDDSRSRFAGKPRVWWKCKVNSCARRGYSGPDGWVRHARRFHSLSLAQVAAMAEGQAMEVPLDVLPHRFVGRSDRWCETCNRPDRNPIHASAP